MTAGPWKVELRYGTLMVFGGEDGTDFVAEVTEDAARLIAAAPDLLAALKQVLANVDPYWKGQDERDAERLIARIGGDE